MIGGQKWSVILEIPQLACYNPEINWKTGEVKMTKYLKECKKQQRSKQEKTGWQKQKEEEAKEKAERKQEKKKIEKKLKKKLKIIEVKKAVKEQEIWDEEGEAVKSEEEAKKLVPEKFHKWIKVFGKKQLERIPTRKV